MTLSFPRIAYYATTTSVAIIAAAVGTYAAVVYSHISTVPRNQVSVSKNVPESFRNSDTLRKLINPHGHISTSDTHWMTLDVPVRYRSLSDEALLARVVKEFYGGWVFTPERWLLRVFQKELVKFADTSSLPVPSRIWSLSGLSTQWLPPLNSVLFGAWQVVDVKLAEDDDTANKTESFVDLAYGSDRWPFAGCNRFSIQRTVSDKGSAEGPTQVRIVFAQSNCNPLANRRPVSDLMLTFHQAYAMLLYREVMSGLKRWLNEPQQPKSLVT